MKNLTVLLLFFCCSVSFAQAKFELTPQGFAPVDIIRPNKTNEDLADITKAWADFYNKNEYDVYDVTENSLSIDGLKDNAFYFRNKGETFYFRIRYTFKVSFSNNAITASFAVKEIYAKKTLIENTIDFYFTPDGKIKDDYTDMKPSLELTANNILKSYSGFIGK